MTFTLVISFLVVALVNFVFLRTPMTTGITIAVIPVALIGTLAGLWLLDFSINILTLLALVLSVGLIVDDSIVVQENIHRRLEHGDPPMRAALLGAREVGLPVIATTASIVAVLIPLSLMTGSTGRLFREFAVAMAIAVTISGFVALTLVPMLCSRFLTLGEHGGRLGEAFERHLGELRDELLARARAALAAPPQDRARRSRAYSRRARCSSS